MNSEAANLIVAGRERGTPYIFCKYLVVGFQ